MKFNITYFGPEWIYHLRRDFILLLKNSLSDLGHTVNIEWKKIDSQSINLIIGAYFLEKELLLKLANSKIKYININTEIISDNLLNFNPKKVDFLNAYVPMMKSAFARWDVVEDNIKQYENYDTNANFLRWGYHPSLNEIEHRKEKDLDFYFFGMMSPRRKEIVSTLKNLGFQGIADHSCPYFLRNDRISRAKINLNLKQDEKYNHVNSFRICYLINNNSYVISEEENDPSGYLNYVDVCNLDQMINTICDAISKNSWKTNGENSTEFFKQTTMNSIMESLINETFSENSKVHLI
jgi:hypothetical protein